MCVLEYITFTSAAKWIAHGLTFGSGILRSSIVLFPQKGFLAIPLVSPCMIVVPET